MALRPSPPLRTARASCPAYGSSLHNRSSKRTGRQRRFVGFTIRDWGQRTSVGGCTRATGLRHLLFLLSCLINLSRDGRPRGSQLAFAPGTGPYPVHYRRALALSAILYPHPYRLALRLAFPEGRSTGLPRSEYVPRWVRPRLYAGDWFVCGRTLQRALLRVTYLLVEAFCLEGRASSGPSG